MCSSTGIYGPSVDGCYTGLFVIGSRWHDATGKEAVPPSTLSIAPARGGSARIGTARKRSGLIMNGQKGTRYGN